MRRLPPPLRGWELLGNGELIRRAEEDSYEVIVTTDQNMRHQQKPGGTPAGNRGSDGYGMAEGSASDRRDTGGHRRGSGRTGQGSPHTKTDAGRASTDTSEQGLERLICIALTGDPCEPPKADFVREARGPYGEVGWSAGSWLDYDRDHCFDLVQVAAFLRANQPEASESLGLTEEGPVRRSFLARNPCVTASIHRIRPIEGADHWPIPPRSTRGCSADRPPGFGAQGRRR